MIPFTASNEFEDLLLLFDVDTLIQFQRVSKQIQAKTTQYFSIYSFWSNYLDIDVKSEDKSEVLLSLISKSDKKYVYLQFRLDFACPLLFDTDSCIIDKTESIGKQSVDV